MNAWLRRLIVSVLGLLSTASVAAADNGPVRWQGVIAVASGAGEKGPWRQNESRYDYVDDPAVAIDNRGEMVVAWVDQDRKDVLLQRLAADGSQRLAEPVNVSRNPDTFSWLPRVVLAPDDPQTVYLLWQEIIFSGGSHGGDILFARSDDGGRSFAEPINLSRSIGGDGKGRINREIWHNGSLDLAAGPDGMLYAAWTEYHGMLWLSRSTDGGASFAPPRRIAGTEAAPARAPALALAPDGTLYLAWTTGEDPAADIRLAKSADGGTSFVPPQTIAPSDVYSDAPKLAVDAGGVLHVVYGESAGGPFEPSHIAYTRSADGARSFESPRNIAERTPAASAGFPHLRVDGQGNVYVLWELFSDRRLRPRGLAMTVSRDGGDRFSAPQLVPASRGPAGGANGSQQGLLMEKLDVDSDGQVVVANSSFERGVQSRVWLIRGELRNTAPQRSGD